MGAVHAAECERVRTLVSLALDGELSQVEQASLRAHVGCCAACAEFAFDLDALTQELRSATLERPAVAGMARRSRRAVRAIQLGAAAAAAVMVAAGLGSLAGSLDRGANAARPKAAPVSYARALALSGVHVRPDPTHPIPL